MARRVVGSLSGEQYLYAVVAFDGRQVKSVSEIVLAFESPAAANHFADTHGIGDYTVGPVRFSGSSAAPAVRWQGVTT
ncbi:hypothetical protein FDG2_4242 [Candidatus Protofrankia californiensis]|uniref:Uncharacterized protein n=1 Tax=Candidatus Protofrankia californiensis TaxID=1839754 RepID=A0A1C3P4H0_9ACTN|nr:hypothetical protein FDG2_4242 [Candidatus Protofrankia californiensis]